jgi:hypothetical protein
LLPIPSASRLLFPPGTRDSGTPHSSGEWGLSGFGWLAHGGPVTWNPHGKRTSIFPYIAHLRKDFPSRQATSKHWPFSPVAWRHILLTGHYTFRDGGQFIDLDAIVAALDLA